MPGPAKTISIIAQVDGSGTALKPVTSPESFAAGTVWPETPWLKRPPEGLAN